MNVLEPRVGSSCPTATDLVRTLARGAAVVLVCSPPLATLFATLGVMVVPLAASMELPRTDYVVANFSLPARLGTTLETIPAAPYLHVPPGPA